MTAYRLARARTDKWSLLAFALALDVGGTQDEQGAIASALLACLPDQAFDPSGVSARVREALSLARFAAGGTITAGEMRAAISLASTYSLNV